MLLVILMLEIIREAGLRMPQTLGHSVSPAVSYTHLKTVILNGEIDQNALRTLRLTAADLMEALRGKDVFDPRDVSLSLIHI